MRPRDRVDAVKLHKAKIIDQAKQIIPLARPCGRQTAGAGQETRAARHCWKGSACLSFAMTAQSITERQRRRQSDLLWQIRVGLIDCLVQNDPCCGLPDLGAAGIHGRQLPRQTLQQLNPVKTRSPICPGIFTP